MLIPLLFVLLFTALTGMLLFWADVPSRPKILVSSAVLAWMWFWFFWIARTVG